MPHTEMALLLDATYPKKSDDDLPPNAHAHIKLSEIDEVFEAAHKHELKLSDLCAFCLPNIGLGGVAAVLTAYTSQFYSDVIQLDVKVIAIGIGLLMGTYAVSQPVFGYLSDKTISSYGRRKPWMLFAQILASLSLVCLLTPPKRLRPYGAGIRAVFNNKTLNTFENVTNLHVNRHVHILPDTHIYMTFMNPLQVYAALRMCNTVIDEHLLNTRTHTGIRSMTNQIYAPINDLKSHQNNGPIYAWVLVWSILMAIAWGCYEVNYLSLGTALTFDYNQRSKLYAFASITFTIGAIFGSSLPALYETFTYHVQPIHHNINKLHSQTLELTNWEEQQRMKFFCVSLTLSILFFLVSSIALLKLKEVVPVRSVQYHKTDISPVLTHTHSQLESEGQQTQTYKHTHIAVSEEATRRQLSSTPTPTSFKEKLKQSYDNVCQLFKNRVSNIFLLANTCSHTCNLACTSFLPFFCESVLRSKVASEWAVTFYSCAAIVFTPIWVVLGTKYMLEKKYLYAISGICTATFLAVSAIFLGPDMEKIYFMLLFLSGFGLGGYFMIPESMKPDIVDYDEFLSGVRREGRYIGLWQCSARTGAAIGLMIGFELLGFMGYKPNPLINVKYNVPEEVPAALIVIRFFYGGFMAIGVLLVTVLMYKYPITRVKHEEILQATRLRNEGQYVPDPIYGGVPLPPYDMDTIIDI